jgi:hypothetical protein
MGIRYERPPARTPVARDVTCPECDRPLEWGRSDRRDQLVQVHLRYSCSAPAAADERASRSAA